MITEKQKQNILGIIFNMKHFEVLYFKDFQPLEREYIMGLIINQKGDKGFSIQTDGHSERPETITRFRMHREEKFFSPKDYKFQKK